MRGLGRVRSFAAPSPSRDHCLTAAATHRYANNPIKPSTFVWSGTRLHRLTGPASNLISDMYAEVGRELSALKHGGEL